MTEEVIRKLAAELKRGITTEPQVVYLLAQLRKLIERDDLGEKYAALKFHCDWVLHSTLTGRDAREILNVFDKAETMRQERNVSFEELPSYIRREVDRISKMEAFQEELYEALEHYGLPSLTHGDADGWTNFHHLYSNVIQDIPLTVGARRRVNRDPIRTPAHVTNIRVSCELAARPLEYDGITEMMYRIWWKLDIDGETQSFPVYYSFTVLKEPSEPPDERVDPFGF